MLFIIWVTPLDRHDQPLGTQVGFTYKGPEPTSFGDWAHKGRAFGLRSGRSKGWF